jgi:hypothetical protein
MNSSESSGLLTKNYMKTTTEPRRGKMSEQDNTFPFGKFDGTIGGKPDERLMAVLNGLQNSMMIVLQKIDVLEHRLKVIEDHENINQA